jgi:hypothetical protein
LTLPGQGESRPAAPSRRARAALLAVVVCLVGTLPAAQAVAAKPVLTRAGAIEALESLPYTYELRSVKPTKGARAAFRGKVTGPDRTLIHIGVAIGKRAWPVPVPLAGTSNWASDPEAEFTFTDDTILKTGPGHFRANPDLHTNRQFRIAGEMTEAMENALCRKATGKVCGI